MTFLLLIASMLSLLSILQFVVGWLANFDFGGSLFSNGGDSLPRDNEDLPLDTAESLSESLSGLESLTKNLTDDQL